MTVLSDSPRSTALQTVLAPAALVAAAACAAVLGTLSPLITVAAVLLAVGGWLLTRSVDWASYAALFLIYSNLPAVAVNYHGVPSFVASAVVGLLLLPIGKHLFVDRRAPIVGHVLPWLVALAIVQFCGAVAARQPERAWDNFIGFLLEGGLLYLLIVNAVRTPAALRGVTWAVLLAGCLMGAAPLWQQITGNFDSEFGGLAQTGGEPGFETEEEEVQYRLAGPIGEKNRYAQIMLMLVPLALFRLRDERTAGWRGLALAALLLAGAGVFLAFSRSTIVCVGLVVAVAALLNHVSRVRMAVGFAVLAVALLATPQYRARLITLLELPGLFSAGKHSEADGALKGRAAEMGAALLVFLDHPVVGVGPGQFKYYSREYGERIGTRALAPERQAHCLPLDVAAENGLLGFLCLLGLFAAVGLPLAQRLGTPEGFARHGLAAGYFYMLAVYAATGLFLHFAFIRYFWLMLALADVAARVTPAPASATQSPQLTPGVVT